MGFPKETTMRSSMAALALFAGLIAAAGIANAQSTTATIVGRVVDAQDRAIPGVSVTIESPAMQGVRSTVTSETGDYVMPSLPSGLYTVTFELSGFERQQRQVNLAPTQVLPVDAALGVAALSESVTITGSANLLLQTAQVATNFTQDLLSTLPTTRDVNAALLMAPSVHATGPNGFYSIAGSMSFENLFLVNGVTVNENLRGQAHDLYIEDAIQETTVASAGVSAEYGRFSGGVVNIVTKSGGNVFSGSLRDTLNNDSWRALTPFAGDSKSDKVLPTVEYTFGGPIMKDRLWFFTAGRFQSVDERRTLAVTNTPYDFSNRLRRYEGKLTYSLGTGHRVEGAYTRSTEAQTNATFNPTTSMDERSLYDADRLMDLTTVAYSGALSPNFFVEGRFSKRNETLKGVGAPTTDLVEGTMLVDQSRSARRYWSPTFCGVCDDEERDNQDIFFKASYFLSKEGAGSHNLSFGYDGFNDRRFANNHQSGSDYRILGTSAIIEGSSVTPVFLGNGTTIIQWNPIVLSSEGANFRVHSGFASDSWRVSSRVTAHLGLRYDRNDGSNSAGATVAQDSAWSPRVGIVWDPVGTQAWSVTASLARYVAPLATVVANASSAGGNSDTYQFVYRGRSINATGAVTPTPVAVRQVLDWFFASGGSSLPLTGTPNIPGVTPQIRDSLLSPNVLEYASGLSRTWGSRGAVRADFVFRDYGDFYAQRTDMSTGKVTDKLGRTFDLALIENTNHLERRYAGLSAQATYRLGSALDAGAAYTLSRAWGNVDGETAAAGPTADVSLQYPEYKQASWNYPEGDLAVDQRHRSRLWANYFVPRVPRLTLSVLQTIESGAPYGAVSTSGVNTQLYVTNPGYETPLPPNQTVYFFTARDAYRTEGQVRTDVAVSYAYNTPGLRRLQLFGQVQVINLFNQFQLCGCGASVSQSGGGVIVGRIDQTVNTSVTAPAQYQTFNPFTTAPVQGVNWDVAPTFGTAVNRMAYTSPRAVRLTFGVRF
jgi:outer membrane receptor for ferrienterochelin and colicin